MSATKAIQLAARINGEDEVEAFLNMEEPGCVLTVICAGQQGLLLSDAARLVMRVRDDLEAGKINVAQGLYQLGIRDYDADEVDQVAELLEMTSFG